MSTENTKKKILTEALKLFSRYGYEAVSVEQIASAVGIKAPSLYKHYKSKRDIFNSIIKTMDDQDAERAQEYKMPEGEFDKIIEAYQGIPLDQIKAYSEALFLHWTDEDFSSGFRKMLTLEQYRNPEMSELYKRYISTGPVEYMQEVFRPMADSDTDPFQLALEFYGPIYLLYSIYDSKGDKDRLTGALRKHIDRFAQTLNVRAEDDTKNE
ncbi:MAG: TetR/AcrR family transcriptional regulator [Oscillospiraceae bacterium]|nr:TetR/AcrR family transcriptional regulator [Oscillospiraceae bacterium]